jgi:hypothetical protein
MSTVIFSLAAAVSEWVKDSFVRRTHHPQAAQEQFLRTLLRRHEQTAVGRELGLSAIRTIDQFRDRVPVLPYSYYEPYANRIAQGEPNILTSDPVIYLSLTSGSTGKQKLIPITKRSRRFRNRVNQVSAGFIIEAARQHHRPIGKMLLTSSARLIGKTSGGIDCGPISTGDLRLNRRFYRQIFAHPYDLLTVADTTTRHYLCLLFALSDPQMRVIGANFPVLALRLANYLETYAEDLIQDLATGELARWLKLEPAVRMSLERQWAANPKRAAALRHVLDVHGRLTPQTAWNLSLLITARGGTSDFYFERFPEYFGDTPIFGGIYASAEAAFASYYNFDQDGAILAIDAGFFEFIPENQEQASQPNTLLPWEVTVGQRYRILVTNYSGLYRYDIGDVVEVLGFYNQTPIIVFRHRVGGMLSSTTEKTTEFHAVQVMQRLQQQFNVSLENFCITLSDQEIPPHYLVNIELAPGSELPNPALFIQQFDRCLQELHTSYAVKRQDQIPVPHLRILAAGSFATLRQRLLQQGVPESQLKFPHVSSDRHWLAGLTVEQEVAMQDEAYPSRFLP